MTTRITTAAGIVGALLLTLPVLLAQAGDTPEVTRTIDVTLSRFSFAPERIEIRLGERVRLRITAADGAHGFQVRELGLDTHAVIRGKTVDAELKPMKVGTFPITCSEYCGSGHSRMKAWLIVTPGT